MASGSARPGASPAEAPLWLGRPAEVRSALQHPSLRLAHARLPTTRVKCTNVESVRMQKRTPAPGVRGFPLCSLQQLFLRVRGQTCSVWGQCASGALTEPQAACTAWELGCWAGREALTQTLTGWIRTGLSQLCTPAGRWLWEAAVRLRPLWVLESSPSLAQTPAGQGILWTLSDGPARRYSGSRQGPGSRILQSHTPRAPAPRGGPAPTTPWANLIPDPWAWF